MVKNKEDSARPGGPPVKWMLKAARNRMAVKLRTTWLFLGPVIIGDRKNPPKKEKYGRVA